VNQLERRLTSAKTFGSKVNNPEPRPEKMPKGSCRHLRVVIEAAAVTVALRQRVEIDPEPC